MISLITYDAPPPPSGWTALTVLVSIVMRATRKFSESTGIPFEDIDVVTNTKTRTAVASYTGKESTISTIFSFAELGFPG